MRVNKELIQKYHEGLCTPEERLAVEDWLLSDSSEDFKLPEDQEKLQLRADIWEGIADTLPSQQKNKSIFFGSKWRQAAAILLLGITGSLLYTFQHRKSSEDIIIVNNTSDTVNENLQAAGFHLSIGPKSNVEIDRASGKIDFCGAMMINPKQDLEFTVQGTCVQDGDKTDKITFKKGLSYIALNYAGQGSDAELVILEEKSLMSLPPVVKRQLMQQFDI